MPSTTVLLALVSGVFGLVIGSFLNVVIWRVPRGESIVSPPSACPKCSHQLRPYDNIPVISWLVLRGRCRDCGEAISARYPIIEALTAALFVVMAVLVPPAALPAYLWLAGAGVALAVIDLDTKRLPNAITYPTAVIVGVWLIGASLVVGESGQALRTLLGGLALAGFFLLLNLFYPRGMGMGDVKLALPLGFALGYVSWATVLVGGFLAFFLGAVVGVALMSAGKAGRRSALPFGPFMLVGALLALVVGDAVGSWYAGLL
jgi:leader peptidase (prepilin peptidase)/N-methyltransferase